jgi:succinate dehydrogenase / fumarate reductase iron-sulfur subunit
LSLPHPPAADLPAIGVRVFRFDPQAGRSPWYESYSVPTPTALTALEVLDYIYAHLNRHLAYRSYYCLKGVCLACLVRINGKGAKGCERLLEPGRAYTLDPIHGYPVIRDLAVDFGTQFAAPEGAGPLQVGDGANLAPEGTVGAADDGDEA